MFKYLVMLLLMLTVGSQPIWAATNSLVTLDFENEAAGALPAGWVWVTQREGGISAVDNQVAYSGQHSLQLTGTQAASVARVGANPLRGFSPQVGERYLIKAWVRSESLSTDTWIKMEFINKERKKVLGNFFLRPVGGTLDWYLLQGVTNPIPADTAEFWLNINVGGSGTLWVDDVSVELWTGTDAELQELTQAQNSLPKVPPPPADHATAHPSILVRPDEVATLRTLRKNPLYNALATTLLPTADAAFISPLPAEPEPYPNGWEVNHWRQMRTVATQVSNNLETLGFAYLITGQPRYAEEAKRWINLVCSWDINGTTSTAYHDDLGRWLLNSMSAAVDWIYDTLTPAELATIRPVLLARGRELFRVQVQNLERNPYDSHAISSLAYITRAALAISDLPEAQHWLEFATKFYQEVYPPWGGADGGWNEGLMYWRASMSHALEAAEMLKVAGLADLYTKDWYKNTGYFQMYFQPIGTRDLNAFGDSSFGGVIGSAGYTHSIRLAAALNDPYLKWYAQRLGYMFDTPINAYLFFFRYGDSYRALAEASPAQLPRSRAFYDIGWVALHSDLSRAENDVNLFFKSSPLGSVSHSHGEQNSFTLTAWGTPLAISSGYYDWYGSPHHFDFTRQTRSKNSILVDGTGQHYRSIEAAGEITQFYTGAGYDYTAGQAAQAYAGQLNDFQRGILYAVPDYFVIVDQLQAPKPVHYNWLLHTLAPPEVDATTQTLHVRQGDVGLQVNFLQPRALRFEVTDRPLADGDALTVYKANEVPPESEPRKQYHLAVTTRDAAPSGFFVTVLQPYRQAAPHLHFSGSQYGHLYQILATGTERKDVTLISVGGRAEHLQGEGVTAMARLASVSWQKQQLAKLLLHEGQQLTLADGTWVKASAPATLSIEYAAKQVMLSTQLAQPTEIDLPVSQRPTHVVVNEVESTAYSWQDGQLQIALPSGETQVRLML